MDRLTFISDLVDSLAWPGLLLFIFCTLWYYFPKLAPFVQTLKYGGLELTFRQEANAVATASAALLGKEEADEEEDGATGAVVKLPASEGSTMSPGVIAPATQQPAPPPHEERTTNAENRTAFARGTSWRDIDTNPTLAARYLSRMRITSLAEQEPKEAVLAAWNWVERTAMDAVNCPPDNRGYGDPLTSVIIQGKYPRHFTPAEVIIYKSLHNMRNQIIHDPDTKVSHLDALNYIQAAWNLMKSIRERRPTASVPSAE